MDQDTTSTPLAEQFLSRERGGDGAARFAAAESIDVPVEGGTVRVFYSRPEASSAKPTRPVVFIAGWGAIAEAFEDFYGALSAETELYHVETREKSRSVVERRGADFSMDTFATDVRTVLETLGLADRDPVLMGTCFGSAVVLHGLATGILTSRTPVCVDPMDKLWMPRWIIEILRYAMPVPILYLVRPVFRSIVLAGMKEPVQRKRAADFINAATLWKWRRAAVQVRKWNAFDHLARITQRVYVFNGSHDRFHNSELFPSVAAGIPNGAFVGIPVGESRRERLMGTATGIFAASDPDAGDPPEIAPFIQ